MLVKPALSELRMSRDSPCSISVISEGLVTSGSNAIVKLNEFYLRCSHVAHYLPTLELSTKRWDSQFVTCSRGMKAVQDQDLSVHQNSVDVLEIVQLSGLQNYQI